MAINAEGENIEQTFLVIHPFNKIYYTSYMTGIVLNRKKNAWGSVCAMEELWPVCDDGCYVSYVY